MRDIGVAPRKSRQREVERISERRRRARRRAHHKLRRLTYLNDKFFVRGKRTHAA